MEYGRPLRFVLLAMCLTGFGCIGNKAETDDTQHLTAGDEKRIGLHHYSIRTKFRSGQAKSLNDRAVKLSDRGQTAQARQLFHKALAIEPENAIVLTNLGNMAYASGNFDEAIEYYNRSHIVSDSLHLNAGIHLGRSYYLNGEYDKCIILCKYTVSQTDDERTFYLSHYNMTKAYIKQGDCEAAQKSFKQTKQMIHKYASFTKRVHALEYELDQCLKK